MFTTSHTAAPQDSSTRSLKNIVATERQHLRIGIAAAVVGVAVLAGVLYLAWAGDTFSSSVGNSPSSGIVSKAFAARGLP